MTITIFVPLYDPSGPVKRIQSGWVVQRAGKGQIKYE